MTATQEILTAILAWNQPLVVQSAMAAIIEGEGGRSFRELFSSGTLLQPANPNIQVINPGTTQQRRLWTGSLAGFPDWGGVKTSDGVITHAAGAAQDEPATWKTVGQLNGTIGFEPTDQLNGNLFLAEHDFAARGGGDLLAALNAGRPELVTCYLIKVWPGGADPGFVKRYGANMAALMAMSAPPPPPPPAPPPMPPYAGRPPVNFSLGLVIAPSPDGETLVVSISEMSAS